MPRINVDDELRADPRFVLLCTLMPRYEAFGALIYFWEVGQSYWKKGESLIPPNIFELLPKGSELLRTGFGVASENGVYCVGAKERWAFLLSNNQNGKRGGEASARARLLKYGTSVPFNASNSEAKTEQKTEANRSEPKHSSSSSSSLRINTYVKAEASFDDNVDLNPEINQIFDAYRKSWNKTYQYALTPNRKRWIQTALKIHGKEKVERAIRKFKNDTWEDRKKYNDLKYIFGSRDRIDKWCLEDSDISSGPLGQPLKKGDL